MGVLKKKKTGGQTKAEGYDDVDMMVQTLIVLSALMLSFVAALYTQYEPGTFDELNFREALYDSPEGSGFRSYIVDEMRQMNISSLIRHPKGGTLDVVRAIGEYDMDPLAKTKFFEAEMELSTLYLIEVFPMWRVKSWFAWNCRNGRSGNGDADDSCAGITLSTNFELCSSLALAINIIVLIGSVALEMSLTFSGAHEDVSGAVLGAWTKRGVPATILGYVCNVLVLSLYLIAVGASAASFRDTPMARTLHNYSVLEYGFVIPASAIAIVFALWLQRSSDSVLNGDEAAAKIAPLKVEEVGAEKEPEPSERIITPLAARD